MCTYHWLSRVCISCVFSHASLLRWCFHAQQANVQCGSEFAFVNILVVDVSQNFQPAGIDNWLVPACRDATTVQLCCLPARCLSASNIGCPTSGMLTFLPSEILVAPLAVNLGLATRAKCTPLRYQVHGICMQFASTWLSRRLLLDLEVQSLS